MNKFLLAIMCIYSSMLFAEEQAITVVGEGSIASTPDLFKFSIHVEEKGKLVSKLNTIVSKKTELIIKLLQKQGVQDNDIQSMRVQLRPWFEQRQHVREQSGFVLTRQIQVILRNMQHYAPVIDGVLKIGATGIDGFGYFLEHKQDAYMLALEKSVKDARRRAEKLAKSLDVKVGKVLSITEQSGFQPSSGHRMMSMADNGSANMPGQVATNARVEAVFSLVH